MPGFLQVHCFLTVSETVAFAYIQSEHMRKLVERLPLESLLLETDAPALGPVQRTRNVPSNIVRSLTCVAEVKALSEAEVGRRLLMKSEGVFTKAFKD